MKKVLNLSIILSAFLLLWSCNDLEPTYHKESKQQESEEPDIDQPTSEREYSFDGTYYHDLPLPGWETETRNRMEMMATLTWSPSASMPKTGDQYGVYYPAGQPVTGLPYSNVSGTMGFLGRDVSFYTFFSALKNWKSKLYTVDYRTTSSYKTKSSLYGTVCSSAVEFAWGLPATYVTKYIYNGLAPYVNKKESQSVQEINLYDAYCWYSTKSDGGHMAMVSDIFRDKDGEVKFVSIFESVHPLSTTTTYTPAQLESKLAGFPAKGYFFEFNSAEAYGNIESPRFAEQSKSDLVTVCPTSLCTNIGDRVSFSSGSAVTINILSSGYKDIELYKDEKLYLTKALNSMDDVVYQSLPIGLYKAKLTDGSRSSEYTYFEIGDVDYNASYGNGILMITCTGNDTVPQYVTLSDGVGMSRLLSRYSDRQWIYTGSIGSVTQCTVTFAGHYGSYVGSKKTITKN